VKKRKTLLLRFSIVLALLLSFSSLSAPAAVFAQTPTGDITAVLDFNPGSIAFEETSRLTITLNNASGTDLTQTSFSLSLYTDPLPNLMVDDEFLDSDCGGTVTAGTGAQTITLVDGIIPANGSCAIEVNISANADGTHNVGFAAGDIEGYYGAAIPANHYTNEDPAGSNLEVYAFSFSATMNK